MPFDKTSISVKTSDGKNFITLEDFTFTDIDGNSYLVPAGTDTDGVSTPSFLWIKIPPFGQYWLAAVFHDYLYRKSDLPKDRCDNLFYNAMISLGVFKELAGEIYEGVHLGGWKSFREDRTK